MIVNTIVLAASAAVASIWGDVPIHDWWFWFAVWLMFYYNHIRPVMGAMPKPKQGDSPWYHWFWSAVQDEMRNRKEITPGDLLESAEFIRRLNGKSGE